MPVIFRNQGEADINALTTMGVNVKPASDNPIGHFGTGFKFAVSVILRNDCSITLFSGTDRYDFSTRLQEIRGSNFEVVIMAKNKGKPVQLGFTTQLGRNWQLWQAYRELYCNCLDEQGEIFSSGTGYGFGKGTEGETLIVVKGSLFDQVHAEQDKYILNKKDRKLLHANSNIEIFEGANTGLFYRGVKVTNKETRFTYNILANSSLTEDRTLADDWYANYYIAQAFLEMENAEAISMAIARREDQTYEENLHFTYVANTNPSEAFKEAVKVTRKSPQGASDSALKKYYESAEVVTELYNVITLNDTQQAQFERAKTFLDTFGLIPHLKDYQVIFADNFSKRQTGEQFKKLIILNVSAFDKGTKEVAMTLLEEYIHAHDHLLDMTRDMQNHLFSLIMNCIEQGTGCII